MSRNERYDTAFGRNSFSRAVMALQAALVCYVDPLSFVWRAGVMCGGRFVHKPHERGHHGPLTSLQGGVEDG